MTKKELAAKMLAFIDDQNPNNKDDWYVTDRMAADYVLTQFAEYLGINLEASASATSTKENLP